MQGITQNQAFSALLFMLRHVIKLPLENIDAVRSTGTRNIPVILTTDDVERRHHIHYSALSKHLSSTVIYSGVRKKIACHTFRHRFSI